MDVIENICNSLVLRVQNLEIVFKLILSLYVKVSVSQFRKDLVQAIKLEKTKALRKRVGEKKKKKKQEVKFNYDYILSDISPGKEKSHMQLKSKAMLNEPLLHFSKNDLLAVAKLYGLKISTRSTVEVITKTLFEKIKSCDSMPNTAHVQSTTTEPVSTEDFELRDIHTCESVLSSHTNIGSEEEEEQLCLASEIHSEPQPSTSGSEVPCHPPTLEIEPSKLESTSIPKRRGGKRKGRISRKKSSKRRQTSDEVDVKCKVCMCIFIDDNEDSICCDSCDLWFHRKCVGLQDEKDWEAMSNPTTIYTCPLCI
ncbi:hypothetical protein FSP39_024334 [Pinctada imbricata]|nr:hypothetical protein FSP39_024334 [Pinctada imbricata]